MATDWTALRVEYVHGSATMRELADKHGIKSAGLMRRAAKEGWDAERKQESAKVSKAAGTLLADTRVDELAKFNADDLKMARAIRAKAAAVDTAQKVGRLALGAETAHTISDVTTRELPASVDDFV